MSRKVNPRSLPLEQVEQTLRGQIHALEIAMSQLVRYKPIEWGESVDPAGMKWLLNHLRSKQSQLEAKCFSIRGEIQVRNLYWSEEKTAGDKYEN